jgi:hypothetical protein
MSSAAVRAPCVADRSCTHLEFEDILYTLKFLLKATRYHQSAPILYFESSHSNVELIREAQPQISTGGTYRAVNSSNVSSACSSLILLVVLKAAFAQVGKLEVASRPGTSAAEALAVRVEVERSAFARKKLVGLPARMATTRRSEADI